MGVFIDKIPIDLQHGKMLLYGLDCFDSVLTIVSFLSNRDPCIMLFYTVYIAYFWVPTDMLVVKLPKDKEQEIAISCKKREFCPPESFSDHLLCVRLFTGYSPARASEFFFCPWPQWGNLANEVKLNYWEIEINVLPRDWFF